MSLDFLFNEINKRKREAKEDPLLRDRKYIKISEIEEKRAQEYWEEKRKRDEEKNKNKVEEKEEEEEDSHEEVSNNLIMLPREEVIKRLRARGEPITLFGETDIMRLERLRKLELKKPMEYIEGVESVYIQTIREEDNSDEHDILKKMNVDPIFVIEDREPVNEQEQVLFWGRELLAEWEKRLEQKPEKEKKTVEGRKELAILKETKSHLKPFFVMLKKNVCRKNFRFYDIIDLHLFKTVPEDIFKHVIKMYKYCKEKNYVKANNAYYSLAIGNAAWPMGVTMVGIHERSAREKISSNSIAHVLNDETQRKYITGLKRLMTFHQTIHPTIPSLSVQ